MDYCPNLVRRRRQAQKSDQPLRNYMTMTAKPARNNVVQAVEATGEATGGEDALGIRRVGVGEDKLAPRQRGL